MRPASVEYKLLKDRLSTGGTLSAKDLETLVSILPSLIRDTAVNIAGNYTATVNDDIIFSTGANTITLPSAVGNLGKSIVIKKMDASTTLTIAPALASPAQTINGASTATLTTQYSAIKLVSNNIGWVSSTVQLYTDTDYSTAISDAVSALQNEGAGLHATGVTQVEKGNAGYHCTTLTIAPFTQAIARANLAFGKELYDFPQQEIEISAISANITISAPTETVVGVVGFGSVVGSGAVAVLSGTPTFVDMINGGAVANTAPNSTGTVTKITKSNAGFFDGSTTAKKLFLNIAGAWAKTESLTISGTVKVFWKGL